MQRWTPTATPAPPDAHVVLLAEHDILPHQSLGPFHRTDHRRTPSPGSPLLLYTDGLIERPGHDIDAVIARLAGLLARHGD
ncbi:hypothetical protein [Streptomyces sp. NPDC001450]